MPETHIITGERGTLSLTPYTDRIIRVTYSKEPRPADVKSAESFMVVATPAEGIPFATTVTEDVEADALAIGRVRQTQKPGMAKGRIKKK